MSFDLNTTEIFVALIASVFTVIGVCATVYQVTAGALASWFRMRQTAALKKRAFQGHFDDQTIENATRHFVWPKCTSIDPASQSEISHALIAPQEDLRSKIDLFLNGIEEQRHLLILGGSGTGKTTFLLNYFAHNLRRPYRKRHNIALIHLGSKGADARIRRIPDPSHTVLFLDAFDEDLRAIEDHRDRMRELMDLCDEFSHLVISCRTQFFPSDEEIPDSTGKVRIGPLKAGETGEYKFWRLYIAPFDDSDVRSYMRQCIPLWHLGRRRECSEVASRIPLLSARPMLMAHIPDLVTTKRTSNTVGDLYGTMVDAWMERETKWTDKEELRRFTELLALDIYVNRSARGGEFVAGKDLVELADKWGISLHSWQMTGRSLLNRNAQGNYKFAHRSILEYLLSRQIRLGFKQQLPLELTALTLQFVLDSVGSPMMGPLKGIQKTLWISESDSGAIAKLTAKYLDVGQPLELHGFPITKWQKPLDPEFSIETQTAFRMSDLRTGFVYTDTRAVKGVFFNPRDSFRITKDQEGDAWFVNARDESPAVTKSLIENASGLVIRVSEGFTLVVKNNDTELRNAERRAYLIGPLESTGAPVEDLSLQLALGNVTRN